MKMYKPQMKLLTVKEETENRVSAKRVDIVSLRMINETSLLYKNLSMKSPEDDFCNCITKHFKRYTNPEYPKRTHPFKRVSTFSNLRGEIMKENNLCHAQTTFLSNI